MLRFNFFSLSFMIFINAFSQNREQAVNSKIKDVTVSLSGAEIHRSGKVTLNAGVTELKLKDMLIKEAGVAPSFGSGFGKNSGKFARFNIACRTEILDLAVNRLTKTFL